MDPRPRGAKSEDLKSVGSRDHRTSCHTLRNMIVCHVTHEKPHHDCNDLQQGSERSKKGYFGYVWLLLLSSLKDNEVLSSFKVTV